MPDPHDAAGVSYLFEQINASRCAEGAPPLAWRRELAELAQAKAADMRDYRYFSHFSPRLGSPLDMLMRAGVEAAVWAENIARTKDAVQAHTELMASPKHRANALSRVCREVGIACVPDGRMVIVVQLFSRPRGPGA